MPRRPPASPRRPDPESCRNSRGTQEHRGNVWRELSPGGQPRAFRIPKTRGDRKRVAFLYAQPTPSYVFFRPPGKSVRMPWLESSGAAGTSTFQPSHAAWISASGPFAGSISALCGGVTTITGAAVGVRHLAGFRIPRLHGGVAARFPAPVLGSAPARRCATVHVSRRAAPSANSIRRVAEVRARPNSVPDFLMGSPIGRRSPSSRSLGTSANSPRNVRTRRAIICSAHCRGPNGTARG